MYNLDMYKLDFTETVPISMKNVPKKVLKGIDMLAVEADVSRSELIRRMMIDYVEKHLPENMLKRL